MGISIVKTNIDGLLVIAPHLFYDERGLYKKNYEADIYSEFGISRNFNESSDLFSVKGALRGLHYQTRYSQAKLLHVISGTIYDVAVDLRKDSRTFGIYHAELMKAEDNKVIFVPEGFAHGFITLSEEAIFFFFFLVKYDPDSCGGILWNDPDLGIEWPLEEYNIEKVICTDKDKNWPTFKQYCAMET